MDKWKCFTDVSRGVGSLLDRGREIFEAVCGFICYIKTLENPGFFDV